MDGALRPGRMHDQTAVNTEGIGDLFEQYPKVKAKVEFVVPDGFDLARHWNRYLADFRGRLHTGEALVRLTPEGARRLGVTPTGDGWAEARVPIESIDHAHGEFLRLGTDVEVMAPAELRDRIAATVRTLATR